MCAAPALHAVRSELLGEGGLCVRPVHSPVPAFLFLARPRADPSGAAARVAGRVPSSGSTAPTGVAAVVVVTVAALPWCDGGVEHRRRDRGHGHTPRPRHAHEPPSPAPATLGPAAAAEQSRRPAMAAAADGGGGGRQRRPSAVVAMAVGGGPVRTALPAALLRSCHAASEASSPHGRPWVRHAAAQSSGVTRRASHVLHGRRGVY